MDYQGFLNRLQKKGSKPHTISHCLGSRDAWKWVRRNKWKALNGLNIDKSVYSRIVNSVNQKLVEMLLEGHRISFPYNMGSLYLCGVPSKVSIKEGKIANNYRTDWKKTLELWYQDKEAMEKHITVKRVQKDIYSIRYSKRGVNYKNKWYYKFRANRSLVRALGAALEERKINAEILYE